MGGGYVDQGVITYYSVINTKTVLQTKIPIPQSQSVHFGKFREDRCTKNAPEEPPPPTQMSKSQIWAQILAATPSPRIIMIASSIVHDADPK